jgi:thiamine kinase-like enzyme
LNSDNLLLTKSKQIIFIDYEWGRLNNKYWDIANFIRESNLSLKMIKCILSFDKSLDRKVLCDFIYMCTNYAYQWTFNMKLTPKILKCRKINLVKMNKYYKLFFIANSR